MHRISRHSLPERVAEHLREGIRQGRWSDHLPGVPQLAVELDVVPRTVQRALQLLEAEGVLSGRGLGRSREIVATSAAGPFRQTLRVGILRYDLRHTNNPQTTAVLTEIKHSLEVAGHDVSFCQKSQLELHHEVQRMTHQLTKTAADAWLVVAGSLPLLEWCATQPTPCLALYGRADQLPIAATGLDKVAAYRAATRQLLALGHRRIVLIVREERRKPTLGLLERAFLEELAAHGIQTSSYHLPDWEETPQGFHHLLNTLFQHTPPTAMIISESPRFFAAAEFLARRRIHVPEQVSLISTDCDTSLDWHYPGISHMRWDNAPLVRRVVRWVNAVRNGNPDRKAILFPAEFVPGGSIAPVWKG